MDKVNNSIRSFIPAPAKIAPPRIVIDASRVEYVPVAAYGRLEARRAEKRLQQLMDAPRQSMARPRKSS